MYKGKRIFISGGNGVIGNSLVTKLYQAGAILLVGDLKERPKNWPQDIIYRKGDLNFITPEEIKVFAPEYFFHLAATFERSKETYEFWHENYQHNVNLSHHLMTIMKDLSSIKKVIFASSYLIYDPALYNFPVPAAQATRLKESDAILPRNLNGAAKLNHEIELRFLDDFRGDQFKIINARIYRSYGKNSRDVISRWVRSLLNQESLTVFKKEGIFDYIYAEEVAEGLLRIAATDFSGTINLGNGRARRVEEVIAVLRQHFPNLVYQEATSDIAFEASEADMSLFKTVTGWVPVKQLEDAIPEIIAYERQALSLTEEEKKSGNILVTSISKKVPMLQAVKRAAQKYGSAIQVHGGDVAADVVGAYFVDRFWRMPRLQQLSTEEVITYCQTHNINLIIPTRDGELEYWAEHQGRLQEHGIQVMISSLESVTACLDKLKFYQDLKKLGLPVIETVTDISALSPAERFVVKERFGAGALHMGLNLTREAAISHQDAIINPVFQPFISGKEYSIDVYITQTGQVKGVIVRTRTLVVNGESQITETVQHPALEKLGEAVVLALGLQGHVVLQVIEAANGTFHIIECNSRFGGASTLSLQCGLDSFYWALIEANDEDLTAYPFARTPDKKQVRYAQDVIV